MSVEERVEKMSELFSKSEEDDEGGEDKSWEFCFDFDLDADEVEADVRDESSSSSSLVSVILTEFES